MSLFLENSCLSTYKGSIYATQSQMVQKNYTHKYLDKEKRKNKAKKQNINGKFG